VGSSASSAVSGFAMSVLDTLAGDMAPVVVRKLAVTELPMSGTPAELMAAAGIDADAIAHAAHQVLAEHRLLADCLGHRRRAPPYPVPVRHPPGTG
jgi:hypothetical protein